MFKYCLKQEKQSVYIPLASLMILTMFESLDGGFRFVSRLFSSAFNLFFWLFSSNSTLRNPMQYRRMPNAEMVVAKEGRCCFWHVIFMQVSLSLDHLKTWYVSLTVTWHCHCLMAGSTIFSSAKSFQDIWIIALTQFWHDSLKAGTQSGHLLERTQERATSETDIVGWFQREMFRRKNLHF